jgi:N12 class adenine-specific DNA methylase
MIELYGNKIWNSNTPNKYKKVIIASEDSLDNICQELENSGLNYCAYIFNGEAHIAIGRATATNIDKLDIDYQTVIECNSKVYKTNNIIGTTTYDSIEDKLYRKYNTDFAYKIGQRLTEQGILFSGRIYGKTTTITVDKQYADTLNKISAELKEQRASFMSKSEVVQNESPEESKSVNEKISELHFNESQLSALAPSVKFIQTRNDDNLTDNFVSWFSDCTDFYESQLSALAEIYVDTYQSFSDKSLMFADTSRFNDLKQRFVNDNITAKLTENRGYSTTQLEIIREMVTYGMSESVINLLDYTFSIDEMQNFFTAYKNGSYEDLINLIADIKGTTRTDIEGQIEGGTYTPEIPDYDFLSKNLIFHNPSANHFTVMYFNPDSETGGQFVSTDINYNVAWRGNRDFTNDSERFWRYVEITGNQTLSDVGSKFFRESLNYFYSGEQIAEGLTTDTQKLIADVATAEMIKSGELIEPESFDVAKFDTLISEQKEITSNNSDKNTIVINAFAGPGAGKTTSCLEVAEKLKKQGFVTEYVQEYAKELVYDNNLIMLDGHYEHQFAILNEQMKRINRLYGKVDFIVTDSPILLNNTYLNEDKNTEVYSAYSDSVNKLYGLYNNFNYFVERDTSVFEKEGRIHNLEQSIAIDNELKNMLHNNQIDFDVYTHATIDNIVRDSTIIYAKQLINSYCQDEFDSEADFSDLKKVGVAYTTTEDSKHTVEAVVNLVDYRLETYVDDKLFKEETYADLKDMIDNCLHSLSFDDLVYLSDEELAPFYEEHDELDDVDPAVIRQQLEDAGIVNGELVDEDKLNSDPFIQQVMADAETDAERNFYQNNFDIKVRNYAGALKVSSEEIVNQFNSESEAVPVNEPEQGNIRPTITCDWSESPVFENGKTYSVSEFDTLMKNADDEWVEQRQLEIEEYGSENAVAEAYRNGELDNIHLGYEKTKFIVNMPNGTTHTFRQNIGDGDGGVIDFLKQYPQYSGVVKILEADIKLDKGENEKAADLPITESKEREVRSDEKLQSVDELAVEVENAAPSRAEKAEVTVVNKAEPPTLFDMVESSEQTETSVNDEKAKNYVIEDREAVTGAKTKFQNNIAAIKILKQTEAENRAATPEEQGQLSLYSGWGGLANAFESDNDKWKNEYSELKGLLTDEEYTAARSTVLDSFYTDTAIVDSIYEVIRNAGFEDGNILEPAMGVGNFFGRLPEELRDKVNLYGVEKDSLSGRIAQKLYPQADITIDGFENTRFNDNSFDVAIGNIPFGDFSVNDSKYNSEHLKIHDYFFLKSLDKVRDGGIVAFVTSKGTLDKKDSSFRKTLAERADLVGAVRLPNNAFKSAGTEVTADIIFLQKREKKSEIEPSWVHTGQLENGLTVNNYFVEHPEMILGEVVEGNKMFGRTDDTMCVPFNDGRTLSELLSSAVKNINFEYSASAEKLIPVSEHLTAEPLKLRLQSFYRRNGEIYFYGSDKSGKIVNVSADKALGKKLNHERINSFIDIRDTLRELLDVQQYDNKDSEIAQLQEKLNNCYDSFYSKYGLLHSSYNHSLLNSDGAYPLVASLEADFAKDNNLLVKKSDIFTERVNKPTATINHVDTAEEALAVCVAEKGVIDFEYMSQITDVPPEDLKIGLREKGEIFAVPSYTGDEDYEYQTASEYLSGDIYAKLDMAKAYASVNGIYESNVVALKEVLPTPLKAGDIDINLGATWIDKKYYEQFMYEIFETPQSLKSDYVSRFFKSDRIELDYSEYSGRWNITNKRADLSVTTVKTYGASGLSAYQIFESVLNLSEPKVYKDKVDEYGVVERDKNNKPVRVLDVEATQVVQQKANAIRREFKNWIFKDANRRRDIVDTYNRTFNCVHAREYDGSHLNFLGMNSNIQLHEHQKNAIAHAIYGGNTLFAHSVGAGKTFEMIATAMECKRLGLCHKSLFAVPNHLTEQVGADFLKLYPNANILVATKDDFKSSNRKMLMSKIATGNYDAVVIGHTQLKMLPLSPERQEAFLQSQIDDIVAGLAEMKAQDGNKFTVKEMERTKKNLENQLEKLQSSKKDNTVYFEELGIDKLFVDEAHEFKNLYCATKLQNVSGISSRASQRATELFAKCRYLDEKTGGKGVVFATGTPLSNSVTELHTMMRYLNYDFLASHNNMQNFDNWISAFGVQKKEYELAPAGNKFKERTRIAEYSNLPELMSMFKMVADVKTAETLKLKVPDCELHIVDVEPTELQKELVDELSDRADEVNSGSVDPSQDNMLKITGDGRKLGLDPRLISPDFEDNPNTKLNVCVNNVFDIYTDTAKDKLTQIVFCDLGVPSKNTGNDSSKEQNDNKSVAELDSLEETGKFCVYDDIRDKLIAKGIPATEIAYIHNAKTEAQKSELFSKVRSGEVRILLGSTGKMGTGTNVQDRIIALHDLDVPWRPADLEQRRGRMVRQGNINEKVHLYRYVTKGTFDAYSYQLLETKQKFISQVMTDKAPARKCADVDQAALSYGEIKALCTGDDRIREKLTLDNRVKELNSLKADYNNTKYELEDAVAAYPEKRKQLLCTIGNIKSDIDNVKSFVDKDGKLICKLTLGSQTFNLKNDEERKNAAKALTTAVAQVRIADNRKKQVSVGNICGFDISVINNGNVYDDIVVTIKGKYSYSAQLGVSAVHNLSKIEGLLYKTESVLDYSQNSLNKLDLDYKTSVALLEKPFEYEAELQEKSARLSELTKILNIELAHQKTESKPKTHYFGKDKILGRNKSSKQIQNKTVMKSEPKRSEPEL